MADTKSDAKCDIGDRAKFMIEEALFHFGPPKIVVSDNATSLTPERLFKFITLNANSWKTVLDYSPIRNRRAEGMVGTLKVSVKILFCLHRCLGIPRWSVLCTVIVAAKNVGICLSLN